MVQLLLVGNDDDSIATGGECAAGAGAGAGASRPPGAVRGVQPREGEAPDPPDHLLHLHLPGDTCPNPRPILVPHRKGSVTM